MTLSKITLLRSASLLHFPKLSYQRSHSPKSPVSQEGIAHFLQAVS
ncbi:MAG: hypothetical protein PT119_00615 [Aphanizomenon gracile PMC627.10]|nr:hypothetical protein [Aphanizomenon gracile PMC638.10]MDM3848505.1 hypothetical protein [Aphanizomenon gracile PMC627.10]